MTELMKRYEAETGRKPKDLFMGSEESLIHFTREYVEWLEDQLTWRPVSDELPSVEKDGDAIIGRHKDVDEGLVQFDCISTVWFIDNYEGWYTHWLPIPPAPEGGIV